MRLRLSPCLVCLLTIGCGGARTRPMRPSDPVAPGSVRMASSLSEPSAPVASTGSSDGTTCEQARDQYVEEINMQGAGPADLKADDFAAVLGSGGYLNACDVPAASKVRVCAAVQSGRAVGVTVALDPPSAEGEVCIASHVRQLVFPANAKMDVVNVTF